MHYNVTNADVVAIGGMFPEKTVILDPTRVERRLIGIKTSIWSEHYIS